MSSTNVLVQEEYLLFDDNSIVASVGGSMGLFVGFSVLECFLSSASFIHFMAKKNKRSS
jgi:hypothetical protein